MNIITNPSRSINKPGSSFVSPRRVLGSHLGRDDVAPDVPRMSQPRCRRRRRRRRSTGMLCVVLCRGASFGRIVWASSCSAIDRPLPLPRPTCGYPDIRRRHSTLLRVTGGGVSVPLHLHRRDARHVPQLRRAAAPEKSCWKLGRLLRPRKKHIRETFFKRKEKAFIKPSRNGTPRGSSVLYLMPFGKQKVSIPS